MRFAAAVLLAVVFFADAEAKRSKKKPGRRGRVDKLICKYVEDKEDRTSDRFFVALSQRKSDTTPNPNAIKIAGGARNFTANDGDTLSLKSFDAADCTGTEKVIRDDIEAKVRTSKKDGTTTFTTARVKRTKDESGAELSSFASFQLVGADGSGLMCCDSAEPSKRKLDDFDFILN